MSADADAGAFLSPHLARVPSLERDLEFLLGPGWREQIAPIPATAAYTERIAAVTGDSAAFVAHHYVRYLGDLSGGQHIARAIAKALSLELDGIRFYHFAGIADPDAFKNHYRAALDSAAWSEPERAELIAEALRAYDLNTRVMLEL
jgi:heme oxygenase